MPSLATRAARRTQRRAMSELPLVARQREAEVRAVSMSAVELESYAFRAEEYIREKLGWEPWEGTGDEPGQREVIEAYTLALRQLHEKAEWEAGTRTTLELRYWNPDEPIRNWIRMEAGHTVGKTMLIAGLVNHFFDCFVPSVGYCFAPSETQIKDLLFAQIKESRREKDLPGKIMDLELRRGDNHWVKGKVASDAHGRGTERTQGKHGRYIILALDEAEGIPDFVWDALPGLTSGGICIVLIAANPRTRVSRFHKVRLQPHVRSFRISCLWHPNVVAGREVVPGAVRRDYVLTMMNGGADRTPHVEVVLQHSAEDHTFTLPFPVLLGGVAYASGTIFKPDAEFLFRVMGVAPANSSDNTMLPTGRYEAAKARGAGVANPLDFPPGYFDHIAHVVRIGVDVSRYGKDAGTVYVRHRNRVWRLSRHETDDTNAYARAVKDFARIVKDLGVRSFHVRVDGGGGYGGGVADRLLPDVELQSWFADFRVIEVHFNGTAYADDRFADTATELYAEAAETFRNIDLVSPPDLLEVDLCEREYHWVNSKGADVKRLDPKEQFKRKQKPKRSPDDGDGCALALAPDFLFPAPPPPSAPVSFYSFN